MEKCSNKKCSKVLKEGDGRYRIFDQTYCKDCFIKENRKQKTENFYHKYKQKGR